MAISHICLSCGLDLARVRARLDPALRLPIVTCPECGGNSVRRRHVLVTAWRGAMRRRYAIWSFIAQLVVFNALLWSIAGLSWAIARQMELDSSTLVAVIRDAYRIEASGLRRFSDVGPWRISVWLIASIVAGVWMGATLPHWKRWAPILVWPAALAIAACAPMIAWLIWWPLAKLAMRPAIYLGPTQHQTMIMAQVITAACLLTFAALPAGPLARKAWRRSRARRWRKRLSRARRTRSGE